MKINNSAWRTGLLLLSEVSVGEAPLPIKQLEGAFATGQSLMVIGLKLSKTMELLEGAFVTGQSLMVIPLKLSKTRLLSVHCQHRFSRSLRQDTQKVSIGEKCPLVKRRSMGGKHADVPMSNIFISGFEQCHWLGLIIDSFNVWKHVDKTFLIPSTPNQKVVVLCGVGVAFCKILVFDFKKVAAKRGAHFFLSG